jgi:competence protein ComEC
MQHPLWHKIPLVRLLIPFVTGIGLSMFVEVSVAPVFYACVLLTSVSVWVYFRVKRFVNRWVFGICINACILSVGWCLHLYHNELRSEHHFSQAKTAEWIWVRVDEEPVVKASSYKWFGRVIGCEDSTGTIESTMGGLLVYIGKEGLRRLPHYGDVLKIHVTKLAPIPGPQNPDEFNYRRYLGFRQIFFQVYLKPDECIWATANRGNKIISLVYKVQSYVKGVLVRCIDSPKEAGVAEALLYGYDDDIDGETIQAYANTGTLHVLAVSGMHVGIIYMILALLLTPLNGSKKGKVVKQLLILSLLWVYSLICGFSPSILRATVMFSFIIVADIMNMRSSVYNTLAASAWVLLCYDPNMIANVGFQLSYLAVLGIVFFQPIIANWYTAPNWFVEQVWSITAVSLAAQLMTFPIGLLYFHQFPNYFLFSNLIIIPLTTLILYSGIALLAISKFTWLSWLLGQLLMKLIAFTNFLVKAVEHLPFAYTNGIHISILQSLVLYGIIMLLTGFLLLHNKVLLKGGLCLGILYMLTTAYHQMEVNNQSRMVVYQIKNQNAIHLISGTAAILIGDSTLLVNQNKLKFHLQQHIWKSGIQLQNNRYIDSIHWQRLTLPKFRLMLSGSTPFTDSADCNLLVLKNNIPIEQVVRHIHAEQIVITSAIKPAKAMQMLSFLRSNNIDANYVGEKGAIQLSLPK